MKPSKLYSIALTEEEISYLKDAIKCYEKQIPDTYHVYNRLNNEMERQNKSIYNPYKNSYILETSETFDKDKHYKVCKDSKLLIVDKQEIPEGWTIYKVKSYFNETGILYVDSKDRCGINSKIIE